MWIRFRPWWNKKINDQWWGIKLLVTYHPVNGYQFHSSDLDGCLLLCYWLSLMDFFYFIDIFFLFFLSLSVSPLSLANLSGFDPFNLFDWIVLLIGALLNRQTATNWMIGVRYLVPFIVDVEAHRLLAGRGKSCHRSVGSLRHYHKMTKRDWNVKKKPRTETVSHTNHFEPLKTRLTVGWRIEVSSSSSRRSSRISEEDEGRREGGRGRRKRVVEMKPMNELNPCGMKKSRKRNRLWNGWKRLKEHGRFRRICALRRERWWFGQSWSNIRSDEWQSLWASFTVSYSGFGWLLVFDYGRCSHDERRRFCCFYCQVIGHLIIIDPIVTCPSTRILLGSQFT